MRKSSTEAARSLRVLYQDAELLAVDKPAGVPTQPDRTGDASLLDLVKAELREPGIGLVHRLDRPVSGVVLFARNPRALEACNALFRSRRVAKTYWAIVEGSVSGNGHLEHHLLHDTSSKRARIAEEGRTDGRPCRLDYRVLASGDRYSLLEVAPQGGAFHQIRAQLSAFGHAIKGDVKYGARRAEKDRSIGLHARQLLFDHPSNGSAIQIISPPPVTSIWQALIALG